VSNARGLRKRLVRCGRGSSMSCRLCLLNCILPGSTADRLAQRHSNRYALGCAVWCMTLSPRRPSATPACFIITVPQLTLDPPRHETQRHGVLLLGPRRPVREASLAVGELGQRQWRCIGRIGRGCRMCWSRIHRIPKLLIRRDPNSRQRIRSSQDPGRGRK
jgi:hypothetical protein